MIKPRPAVSHGLLGLIAGLLMSLPAAAETLDPLRPASETVESAAQVAAPLEYQEVPSLADAVARGDLPPVAQRVPQEPSVERFAHEEQSIGRYGGSLRTLVGRSRDIRMMVVYGYARLMAYTPELDLVPDILREVTVEDGRIFTFHLRKGHKWSDGAPFTTEDLRYWWEDVANNEDLSPSGPPAEMLVKDKPPQVTVIDETTIRYAWDDPNPNFLPWLAQARPPFIYRPAHYMKRFHARYTEEAVLLPLIERENVRNWAQLHNRYDNMYKYDNPDLPTLQPWVPTVEPPSQRFVFTRNPFYHRVDPQGRQLPYIDEWVMTTAEGRLIPAKANAGEVDIQARGLNFSDIPVLKQGEARHDYETLLWPIGKAAHFALYPNLNANDPVWRELLRDTRFRRALSLGIDRKMINRSLFFGLAIEGNNAVLPQSPLYQDRFVNLHADYSPDAANRLLDDIGLTKRRGDGTRLLPDGRPLELVIETAGENPEEVDILELIAEIWRDIGVKVFIKPSDRTVMRNRAYAGQAIMTVWSGWNNGVPSPDMSPEELAPVRQDVLIWPKWGEYYQTNGESGRPVDLPTAERLKELYLSWRSARTRAERERIWREMLEIHAEQQFIIGVVSGVAQPVVKAGALRNVPESGLYSWDPGAHFGMYRPDVWWWDRPPE